MRVRGRSGKSLVPPSPVSVLDPRLSQFWAAGFTKRDSTPPDLLGKGVAANFETLSDLTVETPSLNSPLPLKNPISSSTGKLVYYLIIKE